MDDVLPVPNPTTIPDFTSSIAFLATARFNPSCAAGSLSATTCEDALRPDGIGAAGANTTFAFPRWFGLRVRRSWLEDGAARKLLLVHWATDLPADDTAACCSIAEEDAIAPPKHTQNPPEIHKEAYKINSCTHTQKLIPIEPRKTKTLLPISSKRPRTQNPP